MSGAEWKDRQERAVDALIAACFLGGPSDPNADDDPGLLDGKDREILAEIDDDFIGKIFSQCVSGEGVPGTTPTEFPHMIFDAIPGTIEVGSSSNFSPEIFALHRGDSSLTSEAIEEMEEQARRLLVREGGETKG